MKNLPRSLLKYLRRFHSPLAGDGFFFGEFENERRRTSLTSQPHIVSLVVESTTGMPAPSFSVVPRDLIPTEHERVWSHDWFVYFPPTEELAAAT